MIKFICNKILGIYVCQKAKKERAYLSNFQLWLGFECQQGDLSHEIVLSFWQREGKKVEV